MHALVLEPHADDAALSIGGRILATARAPDTRVTILTVAPHSTFTRDWYDGVQRLDADAVTRLRTTESRRAAAILGAQHAVMDEAEATVRFAPSAAWQADFPRVSAAFSAFFGALPFAEDVRAWAERIGAQLDHHAPDALWIPLGVGEHVDHRLVRDAALTALGARAREGRPKIEVLLYEDLPYAHHDPEHAARVLATLEAAGARLEPTVLDLGATLALKQDAVAAYASQTDDTGTFARVVHTHAEAIGAALGPGRFGERAHRLLTLGGPPDPAAASLHAPLLLALDAQVRALLAEHADAQAPLDRLVVLARAPFARPRDELRVLREALPRAAIEVVVDEAHAWQLDAAAHDATVVVLPREPLDAWREAASPRPGTRVLLAAGADDPLTAHTHALHTPALVQVAALITHASATPPT